jgi:hypothetical protein
MVASSADGRFCAQQGPSFVTRRCVKNLYIQFNEGTSIIVCGIRLVSVGIE